MSLELKQELEHWQARAVAAESVLANIAEVRATWSKSSEWEERDSATDRALAEASDLTAAVAKVAEWQFKAANWDAWCQSEFGEGAAKEAEDASKS